MRGLLAVILLLALLHTSSATSLNYTLHRSEMSAGMENHARDTTLRALSKFGHKMGDVTEAVANAMEREYGGKWNCFSTKGNSGWYVSNERGRYTYFALGEWFFILFQNEC
ncbi:dynein light chain lc6flagellar outer arm [Aphelenchoides avenae]|nr:dynein light chain lc6flagellar outer arm [Aphelenchus avenae]